MSLERELDFHVDEELLVPKNEPQDVKHRNAEDHGVAEKTHADPSTKNGRSRTMEVDRLVQDVMENLGAPSNLHKQRRSPERYTGYMALMIEMVETEPYYFE